MYVCLYVRVYVLFVCLYELRMRVCMCAFMYIICVGVLYVCVFVFFKFVCIVCACLCSLSLGVGHVQQAAGAPKIWHLAWLAFLQKVLKTCFFVPF